MSVEGAWPGGLSAAQVEERRRAGQANTVRLPGSVSFARIVRRNVFTILNGVLFGVALLLLPFGRYLDAAFTALPVAANVLAAVILEVRAKLQLERIQLVNRPAVTVRREGADHSIRPSDVVLGDVLVLARGDQAVVDGRVVAGTVELDESILTGESAPVARQPGETILSGSNVLAGRAAVETTQVGRATFASRIASQARRGRDERTPLRRDLDTLILIVAVATSLVALPVALSFVAGGLALASDEAVRAAAVLVAIVPQGLVIMATVSYSLAAVRLSLAGAVVQRIDAAEALSRVDVLCLDKTGTLTTPRLVLEKVAPLASDWDELDMHRRIGRAAATIQPSDRTLEAIRSALHGTPADARHVVPFSSIRRWSGVVVAGEDQALVFASPQAWLTEHDEAAVGGHVERFTKAGLRVLLVLEVPATSLAAGADLPADARVLAVLALREEIRPDAQATLHELRQRGVALKFISGDDARTVAAIATRAGAQVRTAADVPDLERMNADIRPAVDEVDVFGRARPEDKPRIVDALRSRGRFVGMVGDGVNDVLALRRAHVGVAMESGSPAARAVAGIALMGDRFALLPHAIAEGQRIVSAMIAVTCILLARTVYMLVLVAAASLLGLPFPFTPTSNAVLAMVTVGLPIVVLALWVPPVRAPASIVGRTLGYAVPAGLAVSVLVVPVMVAAFANTDVATARTIVTTSTVFNGIALIPILFPVVRDRPSPVGPGGDRRPAIMALAMIGLYALIMAVPVTRDIYDLVPLAPEIVLALALATLVWAVVVVGLIRSGVPARASRALRTLTPAGGGTSADTSRGR